MWLPIQCLVPVWDVTGSPRSIQVNECITSPLVAFTMCLSVSSTGWRNSLMFKGRMSYPGTAATRLPTWTMPPLPAMTMATAVVAAAVTMETWPRRQP